MNAIFRTLAAAFLAVALAASAGHADAAGSLRLKVKGPVAVPVAPCDFSVSSSGAARTLFINPANAGKTICLLAAGSPYSLIEIDSAQFPRVNIRSFDTSNPVTVRGIEGYSGANGYNFTYLRICEDTTRIAAASRLNTTTNVSFDRVTFTSCTPGAHNYPGLRTTLNSDNISITNSVFENLGSAAVFSRTNNILVQNNIFRDIWNDDGIQLEMSSYVTIDNNQFIDFFYEAPNHQDAVQFFSTNAEPGVDPGSHITITNNLVRRTNSLAAGDGTQGIPFMGHESYATNGVNYRYVTITGNVGIGMQFSCISVERIQDFTIDGNTCQAWTDQPSNIYWGNAVDGVISNNRAEGFVPQYTNTNVDASLNNTYCAPAAVGTTTTPC